MKNDILEHDTFSVIDSSKMDAFQTCPRRFFFRYILGWESELPNVHLSFGSAWHKAMEHILTHEYTIKVAEEAYYILEEEFRNRYISVCGDDHKKKNLPNAFYGLLSYVHKYANDLERFKVLHIEAAGTVAIGDNRVIYTKTDCIFKGEMLGRTGYGSLEHKTASSLDAKWQTGWYQSVQMGSYYHLLRCFFPKEEIIGVVVNGYSPMSEPAMKKDGTPYANAKDPESQFYRMNINKQDHQMLDWLLHVNQICDEIEVNTQRVMELSPDAPLMECFEKRTTSCTAYGTICPYFDFCYAWANPARRPEPQGGFKLEYWDPRHILETARETFTV